MRTVRSLIEELQKFPLDCVCFAYDGEIVGIVIERPGGAFGEQGVIYCGENDRPEWETRLLPAV